MTRRMRRNCKTNQLSSESQLNPTCCDSQPITSAKQSCLADETQSQVYTAEKIVGKRICNGRLEYYVKWLGYPDEENTWEPLRHLKDALILIDQFECETATEKTTLDSEADSKWIPEEILGAHQFEDTLKFLVRGKRNNKIVDLIISSKRFHHSYPQLVIDYYQKNISLV